LALIESLSIIAEVAVGLAGFAGVAVVLGRGPGRWNPADENRVRLLLYAAFGALFASLASIGVASTGLGEELSVRCGAAVLVIVIVAFARSAERAVRDHDESSPTVFSRAAARVMRAIAGIVLIAQAGAASGLTGGAANGLFFFGLVALLGYAAFGFARLIFIRPAGE
jgi:hypothetical protein